ncbi:MAG: DNA-deoxyinosine glycosylase [Xanthomonadales bacterium]|nr:DNA-deoxyinosine glycosylase [Xanthomonadales bacterium]
MSPRVRSLAPLLDVGARVLVLGSMPGAASLAAQQYYAHPRNQFWPILGELLGFDPRADYPRRVAALGAAGVAVWDVLAECSRAGSLDAAIERDSEVANDVPGLLAAQRGIRTLLLNGAKAASSLRRHHPNLAAVAIALPSTSPANASIAYAAKLRAWGEALRVATAPTLQR